MPGFAQRFCCFEKRDTAMNRFKVALEIQDACNLRAIARQFVKVVDAAMAETKNTSRTWADPAVVLMVNKLDSLSCSRHHFADAYRICQERSNEPDTPELTAPTIHLNGTSKEDLLGQFSSSYTAVKDAVRVLCRNAPYGRDYYPQGIGSYESARDQHNDRVARLEAVANEIEQLGLAVLK